MFEFEKSLADIINNGTISDDKVVASDVPPWYLFKVVSSFNDTNVLVLADVMQMITTAHSELVIRNNFALYKILILIL